MTEREICKRLREAGIEDPSREAALLLAHFCGRTSPDFEGIDYEDKRLQKAVDARCQHTPLQYLFGEWPFFRQGYLVSKDCLIPRSDTEILVEEAIKVLPESAYFADLCTGSGCIAVSTLAERVDTSCVALEKFPKTLDLAKKNAARNQVEERFFPLCADLLTKEGVEKLAKKAPFDAILSNPPYIRSSVIPTLSDEVQAEPHAALDGGEDGLVFYRAILSLRNLLRPGGRMLLEIGYDQAEAVTSMAKEAGFSEIRVIKDYGGCDRVVSLALSQT
ncbi:MAG: peptide chain release factor N(5)-glutamine methyltransferase [Clostridia bacterium]|nr:peptide chain release factor N(5)-glutamine methyltransferase [Clostridia bacterium]